MYTYKLYIQGNNVVNMQEYLITLQNLLNKNFQIMSNYFFLPTKIIKFTVLRSPHVNKKSREQFEIRKKSCVLFINIKTLLPTDFEKFINMYISILPSGLNLKLVKTYKF